MRTTYIALALLFVATGVSAKDWKEIRFGTDASYAPFESKSTDGKLIGFDIDLGNAICTKLKAKCIWVENEWDGIIPALKAKKFDAILSSMTVSEKRLQQIDFTDKVYSPQSALIAKKGANLLPNANSLKGKRVGVEQGSVQDAYAKSHWEPLGVTIVSYQNQDLVYQDLVAGRLDASLQNAIQADLGFMKTMKGHDFGFMGDKLVDPDLVGKGVAIGLRKGDAELKQDINKALAEIIKDGTYKKLEQKYFSFSIY